jgi:hypothetical protein
LFVPVVILFSAVLSSGRTDLVRAAPLQQTTNPTIFFTSPTASVNENVGTGVATLFVQMDITSSVPVTVEYLTVDGTATAGSDYVAASGVLTFTVLPNAPQTQSFTVSITDDPDNEPSETINLVLRNPTGGAVLGTTNTTILTILDDDPPPTATPTATSGAPPVFVDAYEPNNSTADAYTTAADAAKLCSITFWPTGDQDYFQFWGRAGSTYEVFTLDLEPGIDTLLTVLDPSGNAMATNDDVAVGNRSSKVYISANTDGFYFARILNRDPSNPADKKYCFEVNEIPPLTPSPTSTLATPAGDACEYNSTFDTACLIGPGQTLSLDFVPSFGSQQDTDIFKLWMKPGIFYTCETLNLSSVNDTNIILADGNGNYFDPPIGNDDRAQGDLSSQVSYLSTYTGWLYILVGPVNPPPPADAALYTYDLTCQAIAATPTPTPRPTFPPAPPGTGSGAATVTPTPIVFPTFPPSPTPIDFSQFSTPVPEAPPQVSFQPLPTTTPVSQGREATSVSLTLYYDANDNFEAELTEGIADVAVALYDNATGQLIQFGHTNEAGLLNFGSITASGAVRVEVPFLSYSQIVVGTSSNILLRIAPQPLPAGIP